MGNRVFVGMSGGVDSSVAALLLKQQGWQVEGVFMKNWEDDDEDGACSAAEDLSDAKSVCNVLGIPLHTVNFSKTYWDRVFAHFLESYRSGFTPNPDILCNKEIKFKAFLSHCLALGADKIATGHYVRLAEQDGEYKLQPAVDTQKDQSYFLYTLSQQALSRCLFPLGGILKPEIRRLANEAGLYTHDKKDSTGICFIGERPFKAFLSEFLAPKPGEIQTTDGEVIGRHDGLMYHTLGQRQGLKIGGRQASTGEPWYVIGKDMPRNVLIAGQGSSHPGLYSSVLWANDAHWISGQPPVLPLRCHVKTRYRQPHQACTLSWDREQRLQAVFETPQRAVTPGQAIVIYHGENCLGGATIQCSDAPIGLKEKSDG